MQFSRKCLVRYQVRTMLQITTNYLILKTITLNKSSKVNLFHFELYVYVLVLFFLPLASLEFYPIHLKKEIKLKNIHRYKQTNMQASEISHIYLNF